MSRGHITCVVRDKALEDSPEERVRQAVLRKLMAPPYNYPKHDLHSELQIEMGSAKKRADIAIFLPGDPHEMDHARIVIECKRREVTGEQLRELGQLKSYLSACHNAVWGVKTNGFTWIVVREVNVKGTIELCEGGDIPYASNLSRALQASRVSERSAPVARSKTRPQSRPRKKASNQAGFMAAIVFLAAAAGVGYMVTADEDGKTRSSSTATSHSAAHVAAATSAAPAPVISVAPAPITSPPPRQIISGTPAPIMSTPTTPTPITPAVPATIAPVATINDGSDVNRPILAPGDVSLVDRSGGWVWGNRCYTHLQAHKYGWARAACETGLRVASPQYRPMLLSYEGAIETYARSVNATGNRDVTH